MKKLICSIFAAIMVLAALTGCGNAAKDEASMVSNVASDTVSGAEKIADDAGSAASDAVNGTETNNGTVSDGDGFIGNEDENETNSTQPSQENTASSDTLV